MTATPPRRSTDSPEARAEFLRGLPKSGFVPPEEYTFTALPAVRELRADLDAFSENFWSMPPAQRRVEWQSLAIRAASDRRCEIRVQRMEPLLECAGEAGAEFSGQQGMIVLALKEMGTLSPPERAVRRAAFLREVKPPLHPWQRAAAVVLDRRPDLAALDRPLIERLIYAGIGKWRPPRQPMPATFQEMAAVGWNFPAEVPVEPAPKPERPVQNAYAKTLTWVLVVLSMMAVRVFTSSNRPDYAPRDSRPYIPIQIPKWEPFSKPPTGELQLDYGKIRTTIPDEITLPDGRKAKPVKPFEPNPP